MNIQLRRTAVGLAAVALVAAGCTTKDANDSAGGSTGDDASTGTSTGPVTLKDGSQVKLALIPGGAHPYFQPWKTTADQAKTDFEARRRHLQRDRRVGPGASRTTCSTRSPRRATTRSASSACRRPTSTPRSRT